ncbi:UNVERIFIED_CONTAM: hypothetical protein K2H54_075160 [Gekko kuhli]
MHLSSLACCYIHGVRTPVFDFHLEFCETKPCIVVEKMLPLSPPRSQERYRKHLKVLICFRMKVLKLEIPSSLVGKVVGRKPATQKPWNVTTEDLVPESESVEPGKAEMYHRQNAHQT